MTSRLVCLCAVLAVSALAPGARAQNPPPAAPVSPAQASALRPAVPSIPPAGPEDDTVENIKLPAADLNTVLELLERLTGRIVLRPAQLQVVPEYNLNIPKKITKAEAIVAVETVLAMNQIGIAPVGDNFIKIVNLQTLRQEAPEWIEGTTLDRPATGRAATKLFQLEFMRVQEIVPMLQAGILNPSYGQPVILQNANAAFITDSISNLQRVERILQQVDKPVTTGMKPKFYAVRNVKASELVNKLRGILQGVLQTQLGQGTSYSADDRTQQIVVVTDPRQWDFFTELIEKLDQKSDPNTRTEVLYLKHAKAKEVVDVLSRIISGTTAALQKQSAGSVRPGQPGSPMTPQPGVNGVGPAIVVSGSSANNPNLDGATSTEFSALMTVVNDERSNAVVVFGTSDDIRLARELVDKLDITLAQVRIEVVIADVTLDDNHESGISALGLKIDGNKLIGFSGLSGDKTLTVSNGVITRPGNDLAADISIVTSPRKRNNTIITQPSTVTSHGKEAKFFTGETRPVVTGTINSAAGGTTGLSSSSTVTQQQIGTTLTVTPFIGVDDSVQLDLTQTVEDVTGTVPVDNNIQYIIGRRESKNYVSAKSGDILVFSGFRKNTTINETNRLGPIPFLGDLFGARKKSNTRSELVFFIRPIVLKNNPTIDNAEVMKRIEGLPARDMIKAALDPNYTPSK